MQLKEAMKKDAALKQREQEMEEMQREWGKNTSNPHHNMISGDESEGLLVLLQRGRSGTGTTNERSGRNASSGSWR